MSGHSICGLLVKIKQTQIELRHHLEITSKCVFLLIVLTTELTAFGAARIRAELWDRYAMRSGSAGNVVASGYFCTTIHSTPPPRTGNPSQQGIRATFLEGANVRNGTDRLVE